MSEPRFHIVLLNPEIPNNTGAIGRTAAATGCRLHVIHPIGFDMDEKARRRAGLDYWHLVDCKEHESWEAFLESEGFEKSPKSKVQIRNRQSAFRIPHLGSGSTPQEQIALTGTPPSPPATTSSSVRKPPACPIQFSNG